jgi:hypothetical protein
MVLWNWRMLQLTAKVKYADVMERVLYNGMLSGVSLDGTQFFYDNPLASHGQHRRRDWFDCACCPPNIARLLASLGGYIYSQTDSQPRSALAADVGVWVHLYAQSHATLDMGHWTLEIRQTTCYPWDGAIRLALQLDAPRTFTLHLRTPGWCEHWRLKINGNRASAQATAANGYLHLTRQWSPGDVVALNLAMPVRYVYAHPAVPQMVGRVALQRGPLVYCLEGVDHDDAPLDRIALDTRLPAHRVFQPTHVDGQAMGLPLKDGLTILRGQGELLSEDASLYRDSPPRGQPIPLTVIPYCLWANRAPGAMRVWLLKNI